MYNICSVCTAYYIPVYVCIYYIMMLSFQFAIYNYMHDAHALVVGLGNGVGEFAI